MKTSETINELTTALAAAHLDIGTIPMNGTNPHFKSKYAKMSDIYSATNLPLAKNGLVISQGSSFDSGKVTVTTRLFHKSGEWIESELAMKPANELPQAVGSAITYARRYEVSAILSIAAEEDDDAEAAQGRETDKEKELKETIKKQDDEIGKLLKTIKTLSHEIAELKNPPVIFDKNNADHKIRMDAYLKTKNLILTVDEINILWDLMDARAVRNREIDAIIKAILAKRKEDI